MTKIAFIGLGNMGAGMAANLLSAGHTVTAFDLNGDAVAAAVAKGAYGVETIEAAVAEANAVVTMLPNGDIVRSVYAGDDGVFKAARPGTLLIDCSTIDVDTAREVAALADNEGFPMVDAPVSGGVAAADAGTLTFMVGGPVSAFEAAEPVLAGMGKAVIHAGDAGAGQAAKICNNMLLAISMIGTSEAFVLAERLGLDPQTFFDISSKASGQCWSMTSYCPVPGPVPAAPSNRDYQPGFGAPLMLKDLKLAMEAARSAESSTPLGELSRDLYSAYVDDAGIDKDFSGIINYIRNRRA